MRGVTALFLTDSEGRLELVGCTTSDDVAARVAERLLQERPRTSPDRDLDALLKSRARALALCAEGENR